jgi:hypothetical protein
MALQTGNALFLIRCFTKHIIEIENETALLEQLNFKFQENQETHRTNNENEKLNNKDSENAANATTTELSGGSSSSNNSPKRNLRSNKNRYNYYRDDSHEESSMADVDSETDLGNNSSFENKSKSGKGNQQQSEHILFALIKNVFELCIEVPVE